MVTNVGDHQLVAQHGQPTGVAELAVAAAALARGRCAQAEAVRLVDQDAVARPVAHVERAVGQREPLGPPQRLGQPLQLATALGHGALGLGEPALLHAAVAAVGHIQRLAIAREAAGGGHL